MEWAPCWTENLNRAVATGATSGVSFSWRGGSTGRPCLHWVLVSRAPPVHTAMRNCMRDEGGPFEFGNQVLISNHRKLLWSKAIVVNVAEKKSRDFDRCD